MKFQVGDQVRIIRRKPGNETGIIDGWDLPDGNVGSVGYVTKVRDDGLFVVRPREENQGDYYGWFIADELELVRAASAPEVGTSPITEAHLNAAHLRGMVEAYEKILIGRAITAST